MPLDAAEGSSLIERTPFPIVGIGDSGEAPGIESNAQREADRVIGSQCAPPGVLINAELQGLQFRGSTGDLPELPSDKTRFDVLKMARALWLPLTRRRRKARLCEGQRAAARMGKALRER